MGASLQIATPACMLAKLRVLLHVRQVRSAIWRADQFSLCLALLVLCGREDTAAARTAAARQQRSEDNSEARTTAKRGQQGDGMQPYLGRVVASVAESLQSPDFAEKEKALKHLAQLLNDDEDADALCACLRDAGVIKQLCELLEHPGPIAQIAIFLVGNVASEARDSTD